MTKTWWKGKPSFKFKHKTQKLSVQKIGSNKILLWKHENNIT
jgi:hypothetical protein